MRTTIEPELGVGEPGAKPAVWDYQDREVNWQRYYNLARRTV